MRAAGIVLVVLGALWSAVGAVLLVVSLLWANPASFPDWVDAAASDPAARRRLALAGAIGVGTGIAQLASGLAVQRPAVAWAPRVGLGAARLPARHLAPRSVISPRLEPVVPIYRSGSRTERGLRVA